MIKLKKSKDILINLFANEHTYRIVLNIVETILDTYQYLMKLNFLPIQIMNVSIPNQIWRICPKQDKVSH